ncbi:MAG: hypothetical protein ABFD46_05040 [Armatimonadota bacterium]
MAKQRNDDEKWDAIAGVDGRTRVSQTLGSDPNKALAIARSIEHPWYRCQALAEVVDHLDDKQQRSAIIREALNAAMENVEPNPVRRQDAAVVLVWHIPDMPEESLRAVMNAFEAACGEGVGWKTGYNLRWMAELINTRDHGKAVELALMSGNLRSKRRALRAIGERELAERYYETNHP